jgi:hypothetical protein
MSNDDFSPRRPMEKGERKRVRIFEPLKWGALPDFWVYLTGAVILTGIAAVGGAYLLVKLGVQ